ncbi:MAG: tRNA (cytidine(34)-2'-O)-methyltransferase [Alkalispirochaeta sp.]
MIHVVLYEPEIPPNTGNIARTCAATGTPLHLIKPLGFSISDRHLRRAGLDYWDDLDLVVHDDFTAFERSLDGGSVRLALLTTKGTLRYDQIRPPLPEEELYLLFGPETRGLPADLLARHREHRYRVPMKQGLRSLNLSNSVAIVLYEQLRKRDFADLV